LGYLGVELSSNSKKFKSRIGILISMSKRKLRSEDAMFRVPPSIGPVKPSNMVNKRTRSTVLSSAGAS